MQTRFKQFNILTILIAAVLVLAACSAAPTATPVPPTQAPVPTLAPTAVPPTAAPTDVPPTAAPAGVTVTDAAGRSVTFAAPPSQIVSLAPSNTEIVCALGKCSALIGRDQFSDFPAEVKALPVLSDGFNPNYEQIVATKPDLVLIASISSPDVVKKFDELKIPALVIGDANSSFDSVKKDISLVGKALGADAAAADVVAGMDKKLANIKAKVAAAKTKPRVFWELDATDPAKPYTPGPGTFVNEIIELAAGENIAASATSPYVQINAEEVIRANPQVIIMSDAAYGVAPESVGQRPGWNVIEAVKANQVYPIDDNLVSRPGPRVIEGLEAAAKLIHPELFQ